MPNDSSEKISAKLICESCGKEFSCGANAQECWCFAVEVKAETLAKVREDFKNCLCEDCLSNYQEPRVEKTDLA